MLVGDVEGECQGIGAISGVSHRTGEERFGQLRPNGEIRPPHWGNRISLAPCACPRTDVGCSFSTNAAILLILSTARTERSGKARPGTASLRRLCGSRRDCAAARFRAVSTSSIGKCTEPPCLPERTDSEPTSESGSMGSAYGWYSPRAQSRVDANAVFNTAGSSWALARRSRRPCNLPSASHRAFPSLSIAILGVHERQYTLACVGEFDDAKPDVYRKEIRLRISACEMLISVIERAESQLQETGST